MVKGSCQDELDHFFKVLTGAKTAVRAVTKAALTKARKKLRHEAFIELSQNVVRFFYGNFPHRTWLGHVLLAIDGSTMKVPETEENAGHFGTWRGRQLARVSQLFDVLNRITIDAVIAPNSQGERELAAAHLPYIMPNDLVLLDRGYPAFWLFRLILDMFANFCARLPVELWKDAKRFLRSGKYQEILTLSPSAQAMAKCLEMGASCEPIKVRLVRIERGGKPPQVLALSLLDENLYPYADLLDLYENRWPIEEDYKALKLRLELENFSGKSVHSVYQDFHAKVFAKNLATALTHHINELESLETISKKHRYRVNFTQTLSKLKDTMVLLFTEPRKRMIRILGDFLAVLARTLEPKRPDRTFPRNHKMLRKPFYPAYKPAR